MPNTAFHQSLSSGHTGRIRLPALFAVLVAAAMLCGCGRTDAPPRGPITFNKHVAPVLYQHCASCHRPGQNGRFALLTYADAKQRAGAILEAVTQRYMPPWLPDGPRGQFVDDRRLSDAEIDLVRRWVTDGTIEGHAKDLPPIPAFSSDWPLGKPDLVVSLPEPYSLPETGKDVYRSFVIPLGNKIRRYVRAFDLRPGSPAVHHAFVAFDRSGVARRWDARDPEPGFASFTLPPGLEMPNHFLGWHPGKQVVEAPRGLEWPLEPNSDLVLQLHMRPGGERWKVAPQAAFYFTSQPPTNQPLKLQIATMQIAIPAGASNHVVRSTFPITADADLLALQPHAHFLAREFTGRVRTPDGRTQTLLHIPRWEFNWQDAYRYARPVFIPAGSTLEMEVSYDNSAANPNNPNWPPRPVAYGLESSDEMAVLSAQILPRSPAAAERLTQSIYEDLGRWMFEYNTYVLQREPTNAHAHVGIARALYTAGQLEAAAEHLAQARKLDPQDEDAAFLSGIVYQFRKQPVEARAAFEDCVRLNPNHPRAHGCLGVLAMEQGWYDVAELHFREAVRIDPTDDTARNVLLQLRGTPAKR